MSWLRNAIANLYAAVSAPVAAKPDALSEQLKSIRDKNFPVVIFECKKCAVCCDAINDYGARRCVRCKSIFHHRCIEVELVEYEKCPVCGLEKRYDL